MNFWKIITVGIMVGFLLFLLIPSFEIETIKLVPAQVDSLKYYNLYIKEHAKVLKLRTQNMDMRDHCTYYANNPIIIE